MPLNKEELDKLVDEILHPDEAEQELSQYTEEDELEEINTTASGGSGAHSHNMAASFSGTAVTPTGNFSGSSVTPSGSFSGSATSVVQPYVAVKFMIKV